MIQALARASAAEYACRNVVLNDRTLIDENVDVVFGQADYDSGSGKYNFTPSNSNPDAVRITLRRTEDSQNGPMSLYFARVLGNATHNLEASATAVFLPRYIALVADLSASHTDDSELRQLEREKNGTPKRHERTGGVITKDTGKRAVVAIGFHSLRHSFVSLCREANAPLSVVESIVGHSNPAMTRHYSHTSEGEARKAVNALPSFTGEALPPAREPLPDWARELLEKQTAKTWRKIQAEVLAR